MANGKGTFPLANNDFEKTNGLPRSAHEFRCVGPSMTRQEFADECDINTIMARYEAHLADPMKSIREPLYYDFAEIPQDLLGAMEMLRRGEEAFMTLPATVRREFDNSAAAFVDFAADPNNLDQMRAWGLAPPAPVVQAPTQGSGPAAGAAPAPGAGIAPGAPAGSAPAATS